MVFSFRSLLLASSISVLTVFVAACDRSNEPQPLPQGVQTATGVLIPAEISHSRRGTHLFQSQGIDQFYAESTSVNLRSYEQRLVVVTGTFERNIDPLSLPVMIVRTIEDREGGTQEWSNRSLGIRFDTPVSWKGALNNNQFQFTLDEEVDPILTVYKDTLDVIPNGIPIVVDTQKAIRVINEETGAETIYIEGDETDLVLLFTPLSRDNLREQWLQLLRSIKLLDAGSPLPDVSTGSGSVQGKPCGGPAGILCPQGQYCEITDLQENIGVCKGVR